MKKVKNQKSYFDIFKWSSKQSKTYHATVPLTQTEDFSQVCFPVLVLLFKCLSSKTSHIRLVHY